MSFLNPTQQSRQKAFWPFARGLGNRKKNIVLASLALVAMFFFVVPNFSPLLAQSSEPALGLEYAEDVSILGTTDIRVTIFKLINVFLGIVGIIFLGIIIYGGYVFMMSQGDPNEVNRGKRILRDAAIGLLIILSALAIVQFLLRQFGEATGIFGDPTSPYDDTVLVGGLGNGPIESHYPARDQEDVPRNTMLAITWKEAMFAGSFYDEFDDVDSDETLSLGDEVQTYDISTQALTGTIYAWNDITSRFENGGSPIPGNEYIGLRDGMVEIFPQADPARVLRNGAARVGMSYDRKTITFWPVEPIGSASEDMWYQVDVYSAVRKDGGEKAFPGIGLGYMWNFETSTIIDTTPPKIRSVYPRATDPERTDAANVVLTLEFNEALNPLTASGVVEMSGGAAKGLNADITGTSFRNLEVTYEDPLTLQTYYIAGEFTLSNQYRTIEFLPITACAVNSCGQTVYCLERDETVDLDYTVYAYAAFLNSSLPQDEGDYYAFTDATGNATGITDMAVNSFDGDNDGLSQGSNATATRTMPAGATGSGQPPYNLNNPAAGTGDDAQWNFFINYDLILDSPTITKVLPNPDEQAVNRDVSIEAVWNRVMYSRTLNSKNILLPIPPGSSWNAMYWTSSPMEEFMGADRTRLFVHHSTFPDPAVESSYEATVFTPEITSGVMDIYQNCYSDCLGPEGGEQVRVEVIEKSSGNVVKTYAVNPFFVTGESPRDFYQDRLVDATSPTYIDGSTQPFRSRLFLYHNETAPDQMSIGVIHNHQSSSGTTDLGYASFEFNPISLPAPSTAHFSEVDDSPSEGPTLDEYRDQANNPVDYTPTAPWTSATAEWEWDEWTDGAMVDLPPNTATTEGWSMEINPTLWQDIIAWEFLSARSNGAQAGRKLKEVLPLQSIDWVSPQADYKVVITYEPAP